MNYRSFFDLSKTIVLNNYKIPSDIDLIVGIPRSGLMAASMLALHLNKNFCDLESYINNIPITVGRTRKPTNYNIKLPQEAKSILILDDSIYSGKTLELTKIKILFKNKDVRITTCAVFATSESSNLVDIYLEIIEAPRVFQWNLMHRDFLIECCIDIDGVLCHDPTNLENDDGENYKNFILNAKPLAIPSYPAGHLVTSRLEKYRKETEQWLKAQNIKYKKLHMLDLPDATTRRNLKCHATFKAEVYNALHESSLFIESCDSQAKEINLISEKPVLSFNKQILYSTQLQN